MNRNNNVEYLNSASRKNKKNQQKNRPKVNKRTKRLMAIVAVFAVVIIALGWQIVDGMNQIHEVNAQITEKQQDYRVEKQKEKGLNEQIKLLNNKNYLQELMRAKYYYTKPGETVYSFPQNSNIGNE
ncbi:FtsB family cell division protein [Fructilactobacillus fructivorans]|uniref:Septum formation initiator family protein n=1 Tax=Fructilactobacillus fructivorans TaxID=1614 RepID=A0A0C1PZC4_9LACO|nr:septum formation initiator family protein [Fructilactobacillus fructivorans]KID41028.1 hypothetical protein LfDm3_1174 [Fructilactobacillus fructivorans]MCT0151400.1 hypothetical protein [Fructilactobacillus fructivorans]MCT2866919.1 hypothetical protein [Fructilactobacillus fructivorans]MCT2869220.1 hypothetical protein [Fructilactobacillus fructivorans]MCT2873743.1 hypothetical protein [Fructilactobacillus fructivorans]